MPKTVKFQRQATPYVPGDVAAFEDAQADAYVRTGHASHYEPEPEAVANDAGSTAAADKRQRDVVRK